MPSPFYGSRSNFGDAGDPWDSNNCLGNNAPIKQGDCIKVPDYKPGTAPVGACDTGYKYSKGIPACCSAELQKFPNSKCIGSGGGGDGDKCDLKVALPKVYKEDGTSASGSVQCSECGKYWGIDPKSWDGHKLQVEKYGRGMSRCTDDLGGAQDCSAKGNTCPPGIIKHFNPRSPPKQQGARKPTGGPGTYTPKKTTNGLLGSGTPVTTSSSIVGPAKTTYGAASTPPPKSNKPNLLLIGGIVLLVLLVLFMVFRSMKKKKNFFGRIFK